MPPTIVLFLVTAIWGSSLVVSKHVVRVIPPVPYLLLRYLIAAGLLLALFGSRSWIGRRKAHLLKDGLVLGVLNALGLCFQLVGQLYTTASKSAFITSLYMPLVPLFGVLLYRTRSRPVHWVAVVLASGGMCLLTFPTSGGAFNPGDLLTVVSAVIYAITILETSHRAGRHDSKILSTAQVLVTAGCFLLGFVAVNLTHLSSSLPWAAGAITRPVTLSIASGVVYMAVICTVVTFLMQNWALARLHVTHATIIFSLEAPVATLIGLLCDGAEEWPGARGGIGACLMLFAVALSQWGTGPADADQPDEKTKQVFESAT